VATPPPIDAAAVAAYDRPGNASVSGRLVVNLPGDRVRFFDKWQVFLVPVIPYTHFFVHRIIEAWRTGIPAPAPDPVFAKRIRSAITNGDGYFTFANLPSHGTYFVYALVSIKDGRQQTAYSSSFEKTGSTTLLQNNVPIGELPEYGYVTRPYTRDYTCLTQGVVGAAVEIDHGEAATVSPGLFGQRNDGC